jgi:LuxR family maltose regulon positive regulatory protein
MKGYVFTRRWVEDCQVRLWTAQDRVPEITRWMQETDLRADDQVSFSRELEHVILARALVAVGREPGGEPYLDDALDLLARLLERAESAGWMGKAIEILALQALAHQGRGNASEALIALERALTYAEPQGYVRIFVDEGPAMESLLQEAAARGIVADHARRLLIVFEETMGDELPSVVHSSGRPKEGFSSSLVEPLSERELEVLQLIAEGLANPQIARRLFLALNTVKVHTRNIYSKLDVHNRTQAVMRARELDLL